MEVFNMKIIMRRDSVILSKSRHIFRDLITYFSRRSDGRSRGNRKSDLPHGGRDDHTGHWG